MVDESTRTTRCREHGQVREAFVCRHLVNALMEPPPERIGFFRPDPDVGETSDELEGWCAACEVIRRRVGGWNDESEAYAGVTLICSECYDTLHRSQAFA